MPLPSPRGPEKYENFIARCMADNEMRGEFSQASQRRAVCEKQWEEAKRSS